jgi:4-hydroxybenzoate polyprenyltransferase
MTLLAFTFASCTALFDPTYVYCLPGFIATYAYLFHLLRKLDLSNHAECGAFFRRSNYIGILILLSLMARGLLGQEKSP